MARIAIGITRTRSLLEMLLMSYSAGASPPTPESAAPMDLPTWVVAVRTAGTAFMASVVPGSPAFSPTEYCTVRPSALM